MSQADHHVEAIPGKVSRAGEQSDAVDVAATCLRPVRRGLQRDASKVFSKNEIDYAADSISSVNRGSAILENFNAIHRSKRDRIEINHTAIQSMRRYPASVEQDQRGGGALTSQVCGACAVIAALLPGDDVRIAGEIVQPVAVTAQDRNQLFG